MWVLLLLWPLVLGLSLESDIQNPISYDESGSAGGGDGERSEALPQDWGEPRAGGVEGEMRPGEFVHPSPKPMRLGVFRVQLGPISPRVWRCPVGRGQCAGSQHVYPSP